MLALDTPGSPASVRKPADVRTGIDCTRPRGQFPLDHNRYLTITKTTTSPNLTPTTQKPRGVFFLFAKRKKQRKGGRVTINPPTYRRSNVAKSATDCKGRSFVAQALAIRVALREVSPGGWGGCGSGALGEPCAPAGTVDGVSGHLRPGEPCAPAGESSAGRRACLVSGIVVH